MPSTPLTHREVRLTAVPDGLPRPEHFTVAQVPTPRPGPGEVLVRNRAFLVFAALLRTMIGAAAAGLPGVRPGEPLPGPAIGEVVTAPDGSGLRPGDLVGHDLGWREYATVPLDGCRPLGNSLPDPVAHLSQGWTAYGALTRAVDVRPGDTVLVTGAAGAVGSLAGQIARLLGAGRVIGTTGSTEKADRLTADLGYDAVVVRGAGPVAKQLADAAPDGIDVLLDTVGGEQLQAAVAAARPHARFVLIGALSAQLAAEGLGISAPVELDLVPIVLKRIHLHGFNAADHLDALDEWTERFGGWLRAGHIQFPHARLPGIDRAPEAFQHVAEGRHVGAVIVELVPS
ncbi:NADP-dependent oxidoreductase [Solwaraspora sp. WMMA2056]|uniref:MDR family NADP-dependent oxidoreductase n=1 Tax=Solwaraspora sp. WMMA2056 TaxID=3015161 RepID=UPI00259BD524|nr:NADP-dependent oxidoreductase [Solwaraspora sp. WMMA2056]WJK40464.1 NADP-dependent oxidoreductase [Solwaraspora sp. WMMA2056]